MRRLGFISYCLLIFAFRNACAEVEEIGPSWLYFISKNGSLADVVLL